MVKKAQYLSLAIFLLSFTACSSSVEKSNQIQISESEAGLEDIYVEESDNDSFSQDANGKTTGQWEETKGTTYMIWRATTGNDHHPNVTFRVGLYILTGANDTV